MISSSRSTLSRFLILYAALYAGFGVQSPYLPTLLDNRHLRPETIALVLAAGTAVRLMAGPAAGRLADRLDAPKVILALCSAAAALIGLGYLPAQGAWLLIAVGVLHSAALAPLAPLSDTLALGAAAPAGSDGAARWSFHYGWLRGCGSAAFIVGSVLSGQAIGHIRNQPGHVGFPMVSFGRRRGRRLPAGRPPLARPHRPGRCGDALRRRGGRAMGGDGRDRLASGARGDRALARPDIRAFASDLHAAFGTMRSEAPRGDSTDHLRHRRNRCCNRSNTVFR